MMKAKKRILVLDDEANARKGLVTLVSEEGYEVDEGADGEAGFERLHAFAPDVVLCDVRMPKIDGIELLKRSKAEGLDASFVMAVEAMRAGAENFIVKPVDANAVSVIVQKVLEKQDLRREAAALRQRVQ